MKDAKDYSSKTLKGRNLAWLVATLVLDVLVLLVIAFNTAIDDLTPTKAAVIRASLSALLPIPALILSSLISSDHKAILVFWRIKHPLPGARAFSVHAPADHRIDLIKLKKNVGEFPTAERDQNSKWYGLYKQVDSDASVVDSHKNYLLFRDIAAMSLLLVPTLPLILYFSGVDPTRMFISAAWFLGSVSDHCVCRANHWHSLRTKRFGGPCQSKSGRLKTNCAQIGTNTGVEESVKCERQPVQPLLNRTGTEGCGRVGTDRKLNQQRRQPPVHFAAFYGAAG